MVITESDISKAITTIIDGANPDKIYLFGSRARGFEGPDSDLDLLIIQKTAGPTRFRSARISQLLPERRFPLDVIVNTPEEFEARSKIPNSIQRVVAEEGLLVYDRDQAFVNSYINTV
jgi:predicted nucleotidyltransferase